MGKNKINLDDIQKLPKYDLPVDFLVYDNITAPLLDCYKSHPCKIEAFIFAYCVKGEVNAMVNMWECTITTGDFAILPPGSFIQIHEVSTDCVFSFAGFSSSFLIEVNFWKSMSALIMPILKNPVVRMRDEIASLYSDSLSLLTKANMLEQVYISKTVIKALLNLFIDCIAETLSRNILKQNNAVSSRDQDTLSHFLQLAYENYRNEHKITFYALKASLTLSHFCSVINKASGMTPQEILKNLIIMDAKAQLKGTDSTISQIALLLGFSTPTTFNRYFKTYTGMTPQEYRKK